MKGANLNTWLELTHAAASEQWSLTFLSLSPSSECVFVCVCLRERERERLNEQAQCTSMCLHHFHQRDRVGNEQVPMSLFHYS